MLSEQDEQMMVVADGSGSVAECHRIMHRAYDASVFTPVTVDVTTRTMKLYPGPPREAFMFALFGANLLGFLRKHRIERVMDARGGACIELAKPRD